MCVVSTAALTYNGDVKNLVASIFHASENTAESNNVISANDTNALSDEKNPDFVELKIINDAENSFVLPGEKNVEVMKFTFKALEKDVVLNKLNFKITGIDSRYLTNVKLLENKNVIKEGALKDSYFVFDNIDLKIASNTEKTLNLFADLSPELHTGERFKINIENFNNYTYVTIARSRVWNSVKWSMPKRASAD